VGGIRVRSGHLYQFHNGYLRLIAGNVEALGGGFEFGKI